MQYGEPEILFTNVYNLIVGGILTTGSGKGSDSSESGVWQACA